MEQKKLRKKKKLQVLSGLLILGAAVAITIGGVIAWKQYQTNQQADKVAAQQQDRANHGQATGDNPSTQPPAADYFDSYQVGPDKPRYIFIPKIDVKTVVQPVGLTEAGAVGTPYNIYFTGWYSGSAKPGQPGAMLIDGHVAAWKTKGIFYDLAKLQPGDKLKIERGDGKIFNYQVRLTKTYPVDKLDMAKLLSPIDPAKPGLNLITCAGAIEQASGHFTDRTVIFAEQL